MRMKQKQGNWENKIVDCSIAKVGMMSFEPQTCNRVTNKLGDGQTSLDKKKQCVFIDLLLPNFCMTLEPFLTF